MTTHLLLPAPHFAGERERERQRQRQRQRQRDRDRETETERQTDRERQRERERERQTDRQTQRERQTDRQRERGGIIYIYVERERERNRQTDRERERESYHIASICYLQLCCMHTNKCKFRSGTYEKTTCVKFGCICESIQLKLYSEIARKGNGPPAKGPVPSKQPFCTVGSNLCTGGKGVHKVLSGCSLWLNKLYMENRTNHTMAILCL